MCVFRLGGNHDGAPDKGSNRQVAVNPVINRVCVPVRGFDRKMYGPSLRTGVSAEAITACRGGEIDRDRDHC